MASYAMAGGLPTTGDEAKDSSTDSVAQTSSLASDETSSSGNESQESTQSTDN